MTLHRKDFRIDNEHSFQLALAQIRQLAVVMKCPEVQLAKMLTSASELARNILKYAISGTLSVKEEISGNKRGIEIIAHDRGPGIANIDEAMKDHYSSSGTLGLGLPGVKRLMDEFHIESKLDQGTRVRVIIWI